MTKRPGPLAWAASCAFLCLAGCVGSSVPAAPPRNLEIGRAPWIQQPLLVPAPSWAKTPTPASPSSLPEWLIRAVAGPSARVQPEPTPNLDPALPRNGSESVASDAPLTLTSPDGTRLRLVELRARAYVAAPLALTEVHLTFENPEPRELEGRFRIVLPQRAAVSRFAMEIDSQWQEGEVLEKQRALETFEDFLHRRQDPALLQQAAGNEFAARVFPIPVRGKKRLIVSYSEELTDAAPYRLRLRGLPKIDSVDVAVHVLGRSSAAARLVRSDFVPEGDLVLPREELGARSGLRSGRHVVLRAKPDLDDSPQPIGNLAVLFDTSASRALDFDRQLAVLQRLASDAQRGGGQRLFVACFDQGTEIVHDGQPGDFGDRALAAIERRGALGASDLQGALEWVAPHLARLQITRLVLLTDAVSTVGGSSDDPPAGAVRALRTAGLRRLDVVAFGGIRDEAAARHLTTSFPQHGIVIDSHEPDRAISGRLARTTHSGLSVRVGNAVNGWPRELNGVQAGDEVLVYAELPADAGVRLFVGGRPIALGSLSEADPRLVKRSWARARIDALLEQERRQGRSRQLRDQIVELSTQHRVLSPYTAFLVLETQADYDRFKIRRDALADILTVTDDGISVVPRGTAPMGSVEGGSVTIDTETTSTPTARDLPTDRSAAQATPPRDGGSAEDESAPPDDPPAPTEAEASGSDPAPAIEEEADDASAGQGFGSGNGPAGGAQRTRHPVVRAGATMVSGRLPPETIQHIVRLNYGRFRACYHRGLLRHPALGGRVSSRFVIGLDGKVAAAQVASSELEDGDVERCIAEAFHQLRFPRPEGGIVTVEYPLVFHLDSDAPRLTSEPEPAREQSDADLDGEEAAPKEGESDPDPDPWEGQYAEIMTAIEAGDQALTQAQTWHDREPGNLLALVALGHALARSGDRERAARAYGSLIDLYSFRADIRRFAGAQLESLEQRSALRLAIDSYRQAVAERPDHASGHHLLGMALLKDGQYREAFEALLAGRRRRYPPGRFAEIERVLGEDLALVAAAWSRAEPGQRTRVKQRLAELGIEPDATPSLRFLLTWETDANDVDLHVYDDAGHHAWYSEKELPNDGGHLYADVTNGYGPEVFTVDKTRSERAGEYRLVAHYYSRGPMGYGLGKLQVVEHDGAGNLQFQEHPFVVMNDDARVELARVRR